MSPKKVLRYASRDQKSHSEYEAILIRILFQMDQGMDKSELLRRLVYEMDLDVRFIATGHGWTGKILERMIGDKIGRKLKDHENEKLDSLLTAGQMRFSRGLIESLGSGSGGRLSSGLIYKKAGDDPNFPDEPRVKPMDDNPRSPLDGLGGFFKK